MTRKLTALLAAFLLTGSVYAADVTPNDVVWQPSAEGRHQLTVSGPEGVFTYDFAAGETPYLAAYDLVDGSYTYELRNFPQLDEATQQRMRATGQSLVAEGALQSGYLTIVGGAFVVSNGENLSGQDVPSANKDQVFLDDLIVEGSACVGLDCANGENFGFDTLRLKENNLRIKFDDTSASASFPNNDWQLTANDSGNGGANKFSLDDITGGKTPFTVEAAAPSHSLYVDDAGNIGVGTSTPVVEVHIKDGDSPTLRLEQDGSSGFQSQTWDLAGNETNFFVRDVTNGSKLPFKIIPDAPTNALYVAADGDIGLGTASPDAQLHTTGTVLIEAADGGAPTSSELLEIRSPDPNGSHIYFDDGDKWFIGGGTGNIFFIAEDDGAGVEFRFDESGNLDITGTLTEGSDVNSKENFADVNVLEVLDRVKALPVTTWNYKEDNDSVRHIGPMSQDFYAAFGFGATETGLSARNLASVSLAALQGLSQQVEEKDAQIDELTARIAALEAALNSLVAGQ